MNSAVDDLRTTFSAIHTLAAALGTPPVGESRARSKEALQLNGLQVVAFAALEDFVRRRVFEAMQSFGQNNMCFDDLPEKIRLYVLTETIAGISFALARTDADEKLTVLQLEGLLLGASSDPKIPYEPSEYIFGRSTSNISGGQLRELFEALDIAGGLASLTTVAAAAGYPHLGAPDQIFRRFAQNRHRAAHGFGLDFRLSDFLTDLQSAGLVFAFAFDTCLSQAIYRYKEAHAENRMYEAFKPAGVKLRKLSFNLRTKEWDVVWAGRTAASVAKGRFDGYVDTFRGTSQRNGETLLAVNGHGSPILWVQPI